MSLDQRCLQYHEAATGTGKSKGQSREMAMLRKFLHKNQEQRFSDKATARLFDTIQIYCRVNNDNNMIDETKIKEEKIELLEDALKMPFTVFNTKQKKTMIKWLEDLRGGGINTDKADSAGSEQILEVIDVVVGTKKGEISVTLMDQDTGECYENITLSNDDALGKTISKRFENTEDSVQVKAVVENQSVTNILECVQNN